MQHSKAYRLARLLGAKVAGLGTVTAVSASPVSPYALVTDAAGMEHHRFLSGLQGLRLVAPQPFETYTRHIGNGVWDEVHSLVPTLAAVA